MSTLGLESIVQRNPEQLFAEMDGETVMLNTENSSYFGLNDVGSEIWNLIEKPTSIGHICGRLQETFSIDRQSCETDVLELLADLLESNLVIKSA